MLIEQKEIMKTQKFMQRKHIVETDEWHRSQVAVIDNIRKEFDNESKQINLKFAKLEKKLDKKIELIHSEVIDILELNKSNFLKRIQVFWREMKEDFSNKICEQTDHKLLTWNGRQNLVLVVN